MATVSTRPRRQPPLCAASSCLTPRSTRSTTYHQHGASTPTVGIKRRWGRGAGRLSHRPVPQLGSRAVDQAEAEHEGTPMTVIIIIIILRRGSPRATQVLAQAAQVHPPGLMPDAGASAGRLPWRAVSILDFVIRTGVT
eukprot:COSAG01_NODE_1930_length_8875_cov_10.550365_3_plen_139_part_00